VIVCLNDPVFDFSFYRFPAQFELSETKLSFTSFFGSSPFVEINLRTATLKFEFCSVFISVSFFIVTFIFIKYSVESIGKTDHEEIFLFTDNPTNKKYEVTVFKFLFNFYSFSISLSSFILVSFSFQ
jgi:hypothetical protein